MKTGVHADWLAREILKGSDLALSQGLTCIEQGSAMAERLVGYLYPHTGRAQIVGVTGYPGAGKSTFIGALASDARKRGMTVGIIAVDPSSPYSGGSLLGDRIRMAGLATDRAVFIRSVASRGALGGLTRTVIDSIDLMDAAGKELILVETVGVGQDEIDVVHAVHTVVLISVPGLGDEIQTLKAGILEIADIHVVNKADREGANQIETEIGAMLAMNRVKTASSWHPPVLPCVATRREGISQVLDAVTDHFRILNSSGELAQRRRQMLKARVLKIARDLMNEETCQGLDETLLGRLILHEITPYSAGRVLLARLISQMRGSQDAVIY